MTETWQRSSPQNWFKRPRLELGLGLGLRLVWGIGWSLAFRVRVCGWDWQCGWVGG